MFWYNFPFQAFCSKLKWLFYANIYYISDVSCIFTIPAERKQPDGGHVYDQLSIDDRKAIRDVTPSSNIRASHNRSGQYP